MVHAVKASRPADRGGKPTVLSGGDLGNAKQLPPICCFLPTAPGGETQIRNRKTSKLEGRHVNVGKIVKLLVAHMTFRKGRETWKRLGALVSAKTKNSFGEWALVAMFLVDRRLNPGSELEKPPEGPCAAAQAAGSGWLAVAEKPLKRPGHQGFCPAGRGRVSIPARRDA